MDRRYVVRVLKGFGEKSKRDLYVAEREACYKVDKDKRHKRLEDQIDRLEINKNLLRKKLQQADELIKTLIFEVNTAVTPRELSAAVRKVRGVVGSINKLLL